jgi:RHS repeat-associated protein
LRITYTLNGTNTTYRYGYLYDALGNIYQENYSVNGVGTRTKNYTYDDSNQLIKEVSFNHTTSCTYGNSTDTASCYIKEFTYDINGNLTLKRTMNYNYETLMLDDIPVETRTNKGLVAIAVMVSGDTEIEIGDSLSLSFMYYLDTGTLPLQIVSGVTTTCTYSAVDTTTAGYYLLPCVGKVSTGKIYNLEFTVLIKVGEPDLSVPYIIDMMSYNYDDTWLDQLENYTVLKDGVSKTSHLTYDLQGNPTIITNFIYGETSYDHATFTWFGRQLMGIKVYNSSSSLIVSISYTYNDQGYRTSKTINGVTTTYTLQDDKVIYETDGSYGILYSYDYDGSLIGFNYDTVINDSIEGLNFFYVTNQSGDITHILNSSGVSVIEYIYDAYGNILNVLIATGYTLVAARNPYTFKGYRYESEINMYYLNSRYYNPEIGRFLNADGLLGEVGNVQSTNMYAYCANNPVMHIDPTGETWMHWAVAGGIVVLLVAATILTGGIAAAFSSILLATYGLASASTAMTLLSFTAVGAALALTASVFYAGTLMTESSLDGFGDFGELGLYSTITGGLFGLFGGYISYKQQMYQSPGSWSSKQISYWKSNGYSSTPKGSDGYPMELHHPYGRFGSRIDIYYPVTRTEHQHIHSLFGYGRSTGGFNQYYPFNNWWQPIVDVFR